MEVDEVRLNGIVRTEIHDEHACTLILKACDIRPLEAVDSRIDDGLRTVRGCEQSFRLIHTILRQILAEVVCIDEDTHEARHTVLLAELGSASGGVVGHMGADIVHLCEHVRKGAGGAHALFRHMLHVVDGDTVLSVELHPRALGKDVERGADKRAAHLSKVESCLHLILLELIFPPSADAPHVAYRKEA